MSSQELKQVGLKVTLPRIKILEILHDKAHLHMTAYEIYKLLLETGEEIGLATVYRVLTQFESAGLVKRHNFEGGQAVFELDHGAHHDHIRCLQCGKIEEFMDQSIERLQREVAQNLGYELSDHTMVLYGRCSDCIKSTT